MNQEEEETDHHLRIKGIKIMKNEINISKIDKSIVETIKMKLNTVIIKNKLRHIIIEISRTKRRKKSRKDDVDYMIPLHLTNQSEDVCIHQKNKKK